MPSFTLSDGRRLHLEEAGARTLPLLIVLHGGPGGDFKGLRALESLSDAYHVVLFDQRGAGLSERVPDLELTITRAFADVLEVGAAFSPGVPFTLVGHSWGGVLAAGVANFYPARIRQMVLVDPPLLFNGPGEELRSIFAFGEPSLNDEVMFDALQAPDSDAQWDFRLYSELARAGDPDVADRLFWRGGLRAAYRLTAQLAKTGYNYTANFASLAGPVLFLAPPDGASPFGYAFQVFQSQRYLGGQVVLIAGSNHETVARLDASLEALRGFLAEYQGGRQ